jgi:lysophospholipase L1-like esterase
MGLGVSADSTFAGIMAAAQDSVDVLNASLPGHASDDYAAIMRAVVDDTDIRRVTVFWCLNDVMAGLPVETLPAGVRVLDNPVMAFVRRHVFTYAWLKATLTDRPMQYYLHDKALYDAEKGYVDAAVAHLGAIQRQAAARGIPMDVVLLPYEYTLRTGDAMPHAVMKSALERMGIRVHDLADALSDVDDADRLYLYGDGIHFSEYGHRRVARELVDIFRP